mgnify:CR=1 FL=1
MEFVKKAKTPHIRTLYKGSNTMTEPESVKIPRRTQKREISGKERAENISGLLSNIMNVYPKPYEIRKWSSFNIDLVEDWAIRMNEDSGRKLLIPAVLQEWTESRLSKVI